MAILDQIGLEKQRICQRLALLETERTKLGNQFDELEIAERALRRFGEKAVATQKPGGKRTRQAASRGGATHWAGNGQHAARMPLGDAALKAVQAHAKGASASELISYIGRQFGLTVRPNHLGMALQRHRRAGRLEHRDQRWYHSD